MAGSISPSSTLSTFVGRARELSDLAAALDQAIAGNGGLVAITGEPGIGKSRLAAEIAIRAERHGANVLRGDCLGPFDDCDASPWIQIIRSCVCWLDCASVGSSYAPPLSELTPGVMKLVESVQACNRCGLENGLYAALPGLLRSVSQSHPLVLILDDLHAADRLSLSLLPLLARDLRQLRVLLIITCRDSELQHTAEFAAVLAAPILRDLQRITLRGLEAGEIDKMLRGITGIAVKQEAIESVAQMTAGNPRFVRLLATNNLLSRSIVEFPEELRISVEAHLAPVSEKTRQLLHDASVVGQEFQVPILLAASDLDREDLLDALSEAEYLGLVKEVRETPASYRFAHPLVRETIYHQMAGARRAKLHARIAELLEQLYSDDSASLRSIATHFLEAGVVGDIGKAIVYCERAAERARSLLAFDESTKFYRMALRATDLQRPIDERMRCKLLLDLSTVQQKDAQASSENQKWGAAIARRINDRDLILQAASSLVGATQANGRPSLALESTFDSMACRTKQEVAALVVSPTLCSPTKALAPSATQIVPAPDLPDGATTYEIGSYPDSTNSQRPRHSTSRHQSCAGVATEEYAFRKEGDYWTLAFEGKVLRLKHLKGASYIAHLLRHPGREFPALYLRELVAGRIALEQPAALIAKHTGRSPVEPNTALLLDASAMTAYKRRLRELREEAEESRSFNDLGRTSRIDTEIEFLSSEIIRAAGLNGRSRTWPSESKRARVSVANAIKTALNKIRREHSDAGRFLATTIRTGYFCSFVPDPRFPYSWDA